MDDFLRWMEGWLDAINGVLWHDYVLILLLGVGVLFTVWSGFTQYRSLTHGVTVIRGKYDRKGDPGAINHFQALSAALSATVGLGNIAGVAVAVALGGPGAVFWMWVVGFVGMALKLVEVTLSMLYRNTDDPDNPHGGPMWVAMRGFEGWKPGLVPLGKVIGGVFCFTLLISAVTGGNMFQAWNVAEVTNQYFPTIPKVAVGIVLAVLVGAVILGGIKRIGAVAGRLVPFMCALYLLAAFYVLAVHIADIPSMLKLIVVSAFTPAEASGAFLGGTAGYAFLWGMKRALFSNEAGQGSSPIAHSAAKTDQPVREGIVAGLEPFIDTIVVCTLTALVVLASGAWNRPPEALLPARPEVVLKSEVAAELSAPPEVVSASEGKWTLRTGALPLRASGNWRDSEPVFALVSLPAHEDGETITSGVSGKVRVDGATIAWDAFEHAGGAPTVAGKALYAGAMPTWTIADTPLPAKTTGEAAISGPWRATNGVFLLMDGDHDASTGRDIRKLTGEVATGPSASLVIRWHELASQERPRPVSEGIYGNYSGAALTSHAFDRVVPGLGMWLVVLASWLFALSTMISWSYYGEQGVVYLMGNRGVIGYKLIYCLLVVVATAGFIKTDAQLDAWTALGTGFMLFANIPIMLIFGHQAMRAYREYLRKLDSGQFPPHSAPPVVDVVEGKDVEAR